MLRAGARSRTYAIAGMVQNAPMRKLAAVLLAFVALPALASDFDKLVDGVIAAYGGPAAWKSVASIEEKGSITSAATAR
jgi:hypothetical protein